MGRRWAAGDLGIADEHAASAAVDDLLVRLGATAESPSGPAVVVASAEHDAHALGGRVVASALALDGLPRDVSRRVGARGRSRRLPRHAAAARARLELLDPNRSRRRGPLGRRRARARAYPSWAAAARSPPGGVRRGSVSTRSPASPATQSGSCEPGSYPHRAISSPRLPDPRTRRVRSPQPRARRGRDRSERERRHGSARPRRGTPSCAASRRRRAPRRRVAI